MLWKILKGSTTAEATPNTETTLIDDADVDLLRELDKFWCSYKPDRQKDVHL
jgi:hypothetical protein